MGASNWIYYVPYQENIEQALQCLRQQVFASGDYYHSWRLHVYDQVYDEQGEPVPEGATRRFPIHCHHKPSRNSCKEVSPKARIRF